MRSDDRDPERVRSFNFKRLGAPARELTWPFELRGLLRDPVWEGTNFLPSDGAPVLLIPGFLSGDPSFTFMHTWLRRLGYTSYRTGIRWNVDCADQSVERLARRLDEIADTHGRPVHVVGHSRGGLFARALIRRRPNSIRQVITLGSPLANEFDLPVPIASAVRAARLGQRVARPTNSAKGCFTDSCRCDYTSDRAAPLGSEVPLTSIFTIDDGVIPPRSCVVPHATCVGVRGTHLGLVVNADVYKRVGKLLEGSEDASDCHPGSPGLNHNRPNARTDQG